MKITTYNTRLNKEKHNILVKEKTCEYSEFERIDKPMKAAKVMCDVFHLDTCAEEYLYIICLNTKCFPLGIFQVGHGSVNTCPCNVREMMIRTLLCGAAEFILVHNHPSGEVDPSENDFTITKQIDAAGELIGIPLLEHIIIGSEGRYYSMREHGYIE